MDFGQVGDSVGYLQKEYIIVNTILHPKYSASNPEFGIWDFALSSRYKGSPQEKKTVKKGDIVHTWGRGVNPSSLF